LNLWNRVDRELDRYIGRLDFSLSKYDVTAEVVQWYSLIPQGTAYN